MGELSGIFIGAVITSCVGGMLVLLLIAFRPLTSRFFGYTWQYYIYLAALVIMLVPISFGSSYSPYPKPIEAEKAEVQSDAGNRGKRGRWRYIYTAAGYRAGDGKQSRNVCRKCNRRT